MDCYLSYLKGHTSDVNSISISDTYLASGSSDGTIRIWDTNNEKSIRRLTDPSFFPSGSIENVCLSNYDLIASSSSSLYFFDIRNPSRIIIQESLSTLELPDEVSQISLKSDRLILSLDNGCISLMDFQSKQPISYLSSHGNVSIIFRSVRPHSLPHAT